LLARHFLQQYNAEQNKSVQRFSSEAMRLLLDYDWPGNVRELENSIEHATVIAKDRYVEVSDLPAVIQHAEPKARSESSLTIFENERKLLKDVLEKCSWNKKKAAVRLGISRSTLYDKIKKHQITKPTVH
jgi:two-component system response regulator HydG